MIIKTMDESWQGRQFLFRYTTGYYFDVAVEQNAEGCVFTLERKAFEVPREKSFETSLLSEWLIEPQLFGAFEGEELLGFVELSRESWNGRMRIANIWVAEERRGQGVGRALMERAVEAARSAGCRAMVLETQSCNDPAIRFYLANGFYLIGLDTTHYSNNDIAEKEVRLEFGRKLD